MNELKAVAFFDLDGTLLNENSQITPEITEAMQQLKENHVLPVIATGRTEVEIDTIMQAAGIDSCIVMNGQFIRVNGETVYQDIFPPELYQRFYQFAKNLGHEVSFYNARRIWAFDTNDSMEKAYSFIHANMPEIVSEFPDETVNMLLVLGSDHDEQYLAAFPELTFYRNSPFSIDTVKKGTNKGTGVKNLLHNLNLTDVPTFGFGDGLNDLALLEACDTAIAMDNARPEVKEAADYITAKNTEGGIVPALKHFELI
ncbi:Cof-type HAD-IIB family hydrolase [Enterococcus sp. HY326]|uniref:Cof-type HAD-IIB family hydrolase n=1 Tax=Enterococcus sp. HY326 TaxID=2971265 RepID=UPI00223FC229|nr:Cof-type HAD-IIB family hydrolase [Enterococcus sp. HY326]